MTNRTTLIKVLSIGLVFRKFKITTKITLVNDREGKLLCICYINFIAEMEKFYVKYGVEEEIVL
jgi:hypothetical protein